MINLTSFLFGFLFLSQYCESAPVGKKFLKGKSLRTVPGYSDGYLSLIYSYNTCGSTGSSPVSQAGIVFGSCVSKTRQVKPDTAPAYEYQSYKMQLLTSDSTGKSNSVMCASQTEDKTTDPITYSNVGVIVYYFNDPACDPQYQLPDTYDTKSSIFNFLPDGLDETFYKVNTDSLGTCAPYKAPTDLDPTIIPEFYSITCTAITSGTSTTQSVTPASLLKPNTPQIQLLNFLDSYGSCNSAYTISYSLVTYQSCALVTTTTIGSFDINEKGDVSLSYSTPSQYLKYNASGITVVSGTTDTDMSPGNSYGSLAECLSKTTPTPLPPISNFDYCSLSNPSSNPPSYVSSIALYKSGLLSTPKSLFQSAWMTVKWYPDSTGITFPNCPTTALSSPQFQYSLYLGYCYVTDKGSYKYQLGSAPTTLVDGTTPATGYELVTVTYNDFVCSSPSSFKTSSSFNAILPFASSPTNLMTSSCFPAQSAGGFYQVSFNTTSSVPPSSPFVSSTGAVTVNSFNHIIYKDWLYNPVSQTLTTATVANPATCTSPLASLHYQANKCIDITTIGYFITSDYYPGLQFPGLTASGSGAVYVTSTQTKTYLFQYKSYAACMADTGVSPPQTMKCKNTATCTPFAVPTTSLDVCLSTYTDNCVSVSDTTKTDCPQPPDYNLIPEKAKNIPQNFQFTYSAVSPAVTSTGLNGWLNINEYYNEGCTGAPIQQYSQYLGNCVKTTTSPKDDSCVGTSGCSYKYQLDNSMITNKNQLYNTDACASGTYLKVSYSDANCTTDAVVTTIGISDVKNLNANLKSTLTSNSKCTRNFITNKNDATTNSIVTNSPVYLKLSCDFAPPLPSTALANVKVSRPYYSFNYYQQTQNTQSKTGSVCANPYTSINVIPNYCLADFLDTLNADMTAKNPPTPKDSLSTTTASYYATVGDKLLRYTYPSLQACLQDATPKCASPTFSATIENTALKTDKSISAVYTAPFVTANAYCTGITDVTPTSTCFSDNTVANSYNQMYTYSPVDNDDDSLSGGAIAGIVIGCIVFALLVCVLIYFVVKSLKGDGSGNSRSETTTPLLGRMNSTTDDKKTKVILG